uniref:hypothetical protein n=1 Tax=Streptomyces silaceus TaxID=545123 RepID=UPI000A833CB0
MSIDTGTLPYAPSPARPASSKATPAQGSGPARPGFWRAPFSAVTFREIGHVVTSLPVAIA